MLRNAAILFVLAAAAGAEEPVTMHGAAADAPLPARVVVLVHGLDEPGTIWRALIPALVADGQVVAELHYGNDQAIAKSVIQVAAALTALRERGAERVDLVGHSMGGLVCRALLADDARYADAGAARAGLPAVRRLIMVATPNHGSPLVRMRAIAEAREQAVRLFTGRFERMGAWLDGDGEAGTDLLPDSAFFRAMAAEPLPRDVALTLIAGDSSPLEVAAVAPLATWWRGHVHDDGGTAEASLAALADGTGDGAVSLASVHLDGVTDELVLHGNHLSLLEPQLPGAVPPAIQPIRERLRE